MTVNNKTTTTINQHGFLMMASANEAASSLLVRCPQRILVMHVDAAHHGAAAPIQRRLRKAGIDVAEINPADHPVDLARRLDDGERPEEVLPHVFGGIQPRVAWLSGWGSRPTEADRWLQTLGIMVTGDDSVRHNRPALRLAVLNNASPIPPMFPECGPAAHPDPFEFAGQIAAIAVTSHDNIDLWIA